MKRTTTKKKKKNKVLVDRKKINFDVKLMILKILVVVIPNIQVMVLHTPSSITTLARLP
jgi:hypothetical protein